MTTPFNYFRLCVTCWG